MENYQMNNLYVLYLVNNDVIISQVFIKNEEFSQKTEVCLIQPFLIKGEYLTPYWSEYTQQTDFYLQPTKIVTMMKPKPELKEKYENLVK